MLDENRAQILDIKSGGKPHERWRPIGQKLKWHHLYEVGLTRFLALESPQILSGLALGAIFMNDEQGERLSKPEQVAINLSMPALMIFEGNIQALAANSRTLNALVRDVSRGNDDAYFHALRADAASLLCKPLHDRYKAALASFDQPFIAKTGRCLSRKPISEEKRKLGRFRLACWLIHQTGQLNRLTMRSASRLFLDELDLYPQGGEDPEASLWKEIKRIQKRLDKK